MSLMPDFERDIEDACLRWHRPYARLGRSARRLAPAVAVGALATVIIGVFTSAGHEREVPSTPAGLPSALVIHAAAAMRVAVPADAPKDIGRMVAYEFPVPPGRDIAPPRARVRRIVLIQGTRGFDAQFGTGALIGNDADAFEKGLITGAGATTIKVRRNHLPRPRPGDTEFIGIVPDGFVALNVYSADGDLVGHANVVNNAYRLTMPVRESLPSTTRRLVRADGTEKVIATPEGFDSSP